jgi:predicted nucleic acid-binding protein
VLSWCFPDEGSLLSAEVAARFRRGDTALAPSFWPHEVLNALISGEKRRRITRQLVEAFLRDLEALPVDLQFRPTRNVLNDIQRLSREHSLTAYDAAYLELAVESGMPMATLDTDLIRSCRSAGVDLVEL